MNVMKTWTAKPEEVEQKWWVVDASGKTLGRLATQIASIIRGKNKPQFTPNVDTGDFVVVVNAEQILISGKKLEDKKYYRHSRFFGSLKEFTAQEMIQKDPAFLIEEAVKGMLPKSKLGRKLLLKLKAYKGTEHPHEAQRPEALNLN